MTDEKLIETVKGFIPPKGYAMRVHETNAIHGAASGDAFYCIVYAFRYGFIQGQKAAKAAVKRERKQLMEQDTSGWYGYLSRWLVRNIDNERLLGLVGVFARSLEGNTKKRTEQEAKEHGKETGQR